MNFDQRYQRFLTARASQAPTAQTDADRMAQFLRKNHPEEFERAELERANEQASRYSMNQQIDAMGPVDQFITAAGIQANRLGAGIRDLLPFGLAGDREQRANEMAQFDMANDRLYENSPITAFAGNVVGGALAAAPLAAATPEIAGPGILASLARTGIGMTAGAAEGFLEYPEQGSTRLSNAAMTGAFGAVGEPLLQGLRLFKGKLPSRGLLDTKGGAQKIEAAMEQAGVNFQELKPETQQYLRSLKPDVNIEEAMAKAMETEFGFKLTRGEATGDFAQLSDEAGAARMSGKAGDDLRAFKVEQNRGIIAGAEELAESTGGTTSTSVGAGELVKTALENLRAGDASNYNQLYTGLSELSRSMGVEIPLDPSRIDTAFRNMVRDHGSEYEGFLNDIGRKLSDFGVTDPNMFKQSQLLEAAGVQRTPLSIANQNDLIKYLNSLYGNDPQKNRIIAQIKQAVDDSADDVLDDLMATDSQVLKMMGIDPKESADVISQARQAREAFREYRALWENSDILRDLTANKAGSTTPVTEPSAVVRRVMSSPENVQRVIGLLQERGATQAIAELRTFVMKDIFDQAVNPNNIDVAGEAVFSGSKLSSILKKQGPLLQALLTPDQMGQLRAFEDQVGKATKRPAGVVNQSNTAYKMMDVLFNIAGLGRVPLLSAVPEVQSRRTMRGALDDTPGRRQASTAPEIFADQFRLNDKNQNLNTLIRQFLQAAAPMTEEEEQRPLGVLAQ